MTAQVYDLLVQKKLELKTEVGIGMVANRERYFHSVAATAGFRRHPVAAVANTLADNLKNVASLLLDDDQDAVTRSRLQRAVNRAWQAFFRSSSFGDQHRILFAALDARDAEDGLVVLRALVLNPGKDVADAFAAAHALWSKAGRRRPKGVWTAVNRLAKTLGLARKSDAAMRSAYGKLKKRP